ncbi:MAG: SH3 domain-containing protein [Chloroflexi bacterium]|nr:SH3 domain-containing protein [Chloroflexota bacterium]
MNLRANFSFLRWCLLFGLLLLAACRGAVLPTPVPTLALPTALPTTSEPVVSEPTLAVTVVPSPTKSAEIEVAPTNTTTPTETAVSSTNTPSPTTIPHNSAAEFAVVFVETNDVLNVRSGPGVSFGIVGSLPTNANDVQIIGSGQLVSGSTWVPVQRGGLSGWVNGRFLTQFVSDASFCANATVSQLLDQLQTAVVNQDDALFAQLIHPERGLRVRLLWYEAETRLDNQNLFSDPTSYNWGAAAGSGELIIGTPADILLPSLQTDLLGATELGCNEILHGGSAGFIVLPDTYAPINHYTYHRPGTEEYAGLNWGSWVVGLELWQGQYFLSTLVHYEWEP